MWKCFFGNMSSGLSSSSEKAKMRFLKTCVASIPAFRWSRWAFQQTYASRMDSIQRKMVSVLFEIRPQPTEEWDEFHKRRRRVSGRIADKSGRWSRLWARSVCTWRDHVQRNHDRSAWSAPLLAWHDQEWLHMQRVMASTSHNESRTRTRACRGKVHRRWEDGASRAAGFAYPT